MPCPPPRLIVSPRDRFGRLTVITAAGVRYRCPGGKTYRGALVICDCPDATVKIVPVHALTSGATQSCGCWHDELTAGLYARTRRAP